MTGLNLETYLRLLRADAGAWATLGFVVLLIVLLVWTSWGSRRILRKCLVLSVIVHAALAFHGGAHSALRLGAGDGAPPPREPGIRQIEVTPVRSGSESERERADRAANGLEAGAIAPWERPDLGLPDFDALALNEPDRARLRPDWIEADAVEPPDPAPVDLLEAGPALNPPVPEPPDPNFEDTDPANEQAAPPAPGDLEAVPDAVREDRSEAADPFMPGDSERLVVRPPSVEAEQPIRTVDPNGLDRPPPRLDAANFEPPAAEAASVPPDLDPTEERDAEPAPARPADLDPEESGVAAVRRADQDPDRPAVPADLDLRAAVRPPRNADVEVGEASEQDRDRDSKPPPIPAPVLADAPSGESGNGADMNMGSEPPPLDVGDGSARSAAPPGDPEAVADARRRPAEPSDDPLLPETDLRLTARPAAEARGPVPDRLGARPDLERVVPSGPRDVPPGPPVGRRLEEIPEVYRPRLDPNRSVHARRAGATAESEEAVQRALVWLARHQDTDGRWDAATARSSDGSVPKGEDSHTAHCPPGDICAGECYYWEADTATTGLALLAFLGAGYTHQSGDYQQTIARGLDYLIAIQRPDGDLRGRSRSVGMYCHSMAALALTEAYALTGDERLRDPVERAVAFLVDAQYKGRLGWRYAPAGEIQQEPSEDRRRWTYDPHPPVGDTSVLGWVVMVLKSASEVGIDVPASARRSALGWLERVADGDAGGLARYQPYRPPDPTMTAEAWVCRQFLEVGGPGPASDEARSYLLDHMPRRDQYNIYYWYYGTLAMFQHGGPAWERWNRAVREELVELQHTDSERHAFGSWDPDPTRYGIHGGRVYTTALAAMTLEVYYRYLRLYASK